MTDTPRIYVASLSDYNAGTLHGRWIDADQDADDIQTEVTEMLAESKEPFAEEWAIHDYDGFGPLKLGEWESFEKVSALANAISNHGAGAVSAYFDATDADDWDEDEFLEAYAGEWENEEEFAESLVDEGLFGEIPEPLTYYIDTEKIARDLFMGDYSSSEPDKDDGYKIHVFRRY